MRLNLDLQIGAFYFFHELVRHLPLAFALVLVDVVVFLPNPSLLPVPFWKHCDGADVEESRANDSKGNIAVILTKFETDEPEEYCDFLMECDPDDMPDVEDI